MRARRLPSAILILLACCVAMAAQAQGLPRLSQTLPTGPVQELATDTLQRVPRAQGALDGLQAGTRQLEIQRLLRQHRDVLDRDPDGAPVLRSEVVAVDPGTDALQRARDAGFSIVREHALGEIGLRLVVLRAREGLGTRAALRLIRRIDPDGEYDYNHLYLGSASASLPASTAAAAPAVATGRSPARIGLIDSGVDAGHPALAGTRVRSWGCAGAPRPDAHGTAVASLLAGDTGLGASPAANLFAADIYCGQPTGGSSARLAEALAWLAGERVTVINLSMVGPPNRLLERAVQAMAARGHVLVAAVGNDGPAAPPLYPAAYPEVIGVTAVDARQRALPEAGRGPQVEFAAPGAELRVAVPGGGWDSARGTSFAAPLVARLAARLASAGASGDALRAALAAQANDLGARGRDNTYGHGLLAASARLAHAAPQR